MLRIIKLENTLLNLIHRKNLIKSRLYLLFARDAFNFIGKKTTIELPIKIWSPLSIYIGNNVFIGQGSWLETIAPEVSVTKLKIMDGVSISGYITITAAKSVTIEENVLIAKNVHISDHSHDFSDTQVPIKHQGITTPKPVSIGEGSWIGQGAIICPGTKIGKNCVIGGNSVVKGDIPDYTLAAGSPAKVIRSLK
ncbi:acyltransferase [Puniceicoccaceae bacterium K14]|nr:acyltransferase [Puniceicoccaceae bacterium K14]